MSLTDGFALRDALDLSLTEISYDSKYIYVTVYYKLIDTVYAFRQGIINFDDDDSVTPSGIPVLRLNLTSGSVTSTYNSNEDISGELSWIRNEDINSNFSGGLRNYTNEYGEIQSTKSQTLRYEYSSNDFNEGSVTIEFLNKLDPSGGGKWYARNDLSANKYYSDQSLNFYIGQTLSNSGTALENYFQQTWSYWFITNSSNPIIIDNFNFNLNCIPNNNIKFSNIYNVLNDASAPGGTLHNGSDPISISDFVSATHPSTDTMAALTGDIDRKFNFISNEPTEVNKDNTTKILINDPSNIYHNLLEKSYRFFDTGGESNDYTDNENLSNDYKENENLNITFDAGPGNFVWINIKQFAFEHSQSAGMYDRLGITASSISNDLNNASANLSPTTAPELSKYLYKSVSPTPPWTQSFLQSSSRNGYILPSSSNIDVLNNDNSIWVNKWYKINTQFVRFYFKSDVNTNRAGWDIYLVSSGIFPETNDNGLVPKNWIQLSNNFGENIIENNGSIILNSTTKNKLYTPISRFTFSDGPNNLPSYNNTSVNGSIIFDAGEGNSWKIDVGSYTFPYSASGFNLFGQLKIESKANESDYFSNIEKPGLAKVNYGQRFPSNLNWTTPGHVFPSYNGSPSYYIFEDGTSALGTSGSPLIIDERYIKFTYDNNVDNSNYTGDFSGWFFTLQVTDSSKNDTENVYNNGDTITDQEVSIKKDFLGRCKNHDPSIQIVEYVDGNYTTDISKNSASGNLQIGLKMSTGAYDLSSSDITIIGGDGTVGVDTFSFTDGDTSTNFFITPPSDALAHKIIIRVKGNTFYNLPEKIWNKPSDNDFSWFWNMPAITITSRDVASGGSLIDNSASFIVTCQHNFLLNIEDITITGGGNLASLDRIDGKTILFVIDNLQLDQLSSVVIDVGKVIETDSGNNFTNFSPSNTYTFTYTESIFSHYTILSNLAKALNNISTPSLGIDEIERSHNSFNVFAHINYNTKTERLEGYIDPNIIKNQPGFIYNDGTPNDNGISDSLSTGQLITKLTGASVLGREIRFASYSEFLIDNFDNSVFEDKPWMGIAFWNRDGFKGIIIHAFTGKQINDEGVVNNNGTQISYVNNMFEIQNSSSTPNLRYVAHQIHPLVFNASGEIHDVDTRGNTGWEFSENQYSFQGRQNEEELRGWFGVTSAGDVTPKFSRDDGIWGFRIGSNVDGDYPGPYLDPGTRAYGIQNKNASDWSQQYLYWMNDPSDTSTQIPPPYTQDTEAYGLIFSGDSRR